MAVYTYTAINASGLELSGELNAPDKNAALEQLRSRGLLPSTIDELNARSESGGAGGRRKKVKAKSLQVFSRQFATMVESGLNVVSALVILEEQTEDDALADVIREVRQDVEGGLVLSQALARHPKVFDRLYIAMVEAGEAAGMLDKVLDRIAFQIEKDTKIKRRVKGAMVYPVVVMAFASLVLIGMLMFIVPVFVGVFDSLEGELPTPTKVVLFFSNLLRDRWFVLFPAIGGTIFGLKKLKQTEGGRRFWDSFKLKIPMKIGDVVLKVTLARFARTLSTLVAAGVDIIRSLEITSQTVGNWVVEEALADVRERVEQGIPIAVPLADNEVFPPMVSHMVRVGEETGELEKMLGKVADFYEDEADSSIAALTSIIEPIMMIGVGLMVGVIIISMYLPMFKMLTLIK